MTTAGGLYRMARDDVVEERWRLIRDHRPSFFNDIILARYATRAVFQEQLQTVREAGLWHPLNFLRFLFAYAGYLRVELKLSVYETLLSVKSRIGLL